MYGKVSTYAHKSTIVHKEDGNCIVAWNGWAVELGQG
jgi:hypothetical protein